MEEEKGGALMKELIEMVNEISAITEFRSTVRKQYCNLARRLKLLTPMFEEIRDSKEIVPRDSFQALVSLRSAMEVALELLLFGSHGSKIYMVLIIIYAVIFIFRCICAFIMLLSLSIIYNPMVYISLLVIVIGKLFISNYYENSRFARLFGLVRITFLHNLIGIYKI